MSADTARLPGTALLLGAGAVILAVVIGTALRGSDVTSYPAGSPEAVAQTYVQAVLDGDGMAAHAVLSPRLQSRCRPYDLEGPFDGGSYRAVFEEVDDAETTVWITVRLTSTDYPEPPLPFPAIEEFTSRVVLEQFGGEWRIVDAEWPLETCGRR